MSRAIFKEYLRRFFHWLLKDAGQTKGPKWWHYALFAYCFLLSLVMVTGEAAWGVPAGYALAALSTLWMIRRLLGFPGWL